MTGDAKQGSPAGEEPSRDEGLIKNRDDIVEKRVGRSQVPCPACGHQDWNPVDTGTLLHLDVPKRVGARLVRGAVVLRTASFICARCGFIRSHAIEWPGRAGAE